MDVSFVGKHNSTIEYFKYDEQYLLALVSSWYFVSEIRTGEKYLPTPNMGLHPPKSSSELRFSDQEERCCPSNPDTGSLYLAHSLNLFKNTPWLNDREGNLLLKNTVPCCSASTLTHVRSLLMRGWACRQGCLYTHDRHDQDNISMCWF